MAETQQGPGEAQTIENGDSAADHLISSENRDMLVTQALEEEAIEVHGAGAPT